MDWSCDMDSFDDGAEKWFEPGSNILLDFHGDPFRADLVVFSDGNHNMALKEVLAAFQRKESGVQHFFYITTPPGPLLTFLEGGLQLGNFVLAVTPHVFMGPGHIMAALSKEGKVTCAFPFVRNQGSVLLVKKGNPKQIRQVSDLRQPGVTLFLSNPHTEKASHKGYADTLANISGDSEFTEKITTVFGKRIHHREAPAAVQEGVADAAVVYYHLGLHYIRLFPELFEIVPLGGSVEKPVPFEGNVTGRTWAGIVGQGGAFGKAFLAFLPSSEAAEIYTGHGLVPVGNGGAI